MAEPEKQPEANNENKQPENPPTQEQNPQPENPPTQEQKPQTENPPTQEQQPQPENPPKQEPEQKPQEENPPKQEPEQKPQEENPPKQEPEQKPQPENPPKQEPEQKPEQKPEAEQKPQPENPPKQEPEKKPQPENPPKQEPEQNNNPPPAVQNPEPQQQQENQEQNNQNVIDNQNQPNENQDNQIQQNEEEDQDAEMEEQAQEQTNPEQEQKQPLMAQIDKNTAEREKKKFSQGGIEDIQHEIQEITKKIEHEKINLRITTERLTQKEKTYNELQGKPVQKTKEEIEKERREHKKAVKNHKLSDPIIRKKGKEKEFYDEQVKIQKAYDKNKTDFEKLTCDKNELGIGNKDLKQQIIDLRKRKVEAMKQLDNIKEENKKNQEELKELLNENKALKDQIKYKEYKKVVEFGNTQEKNFIEQRDNYEDQYHELIKNYVRREKETKKENAKKRQMALLGSGSNTHFKGMNDKDIEKQIKLLAEEEISDRTPILDIAIEKWTEINKSKKITLETHYENCVKIEEAFKKLTNFLGLDNFSELPTVFKKTEQQISNINFYNEKLDLQIDELEQRRDSIIEKIKLLSGKQTENISNKSKFKEQKEQSIKVIENLIQNFEGDMEHKRELFLRIQPITDKYLARLSETYLVDFIPNKANIDPDIDYNEQTVNKYMSNVQDYYKLIQSWDEANKTAKSDDNRELDKLREEMKQKLGGFEKNRIISKKMVTSMKNELKSGMNIEDIIKKASIEISKQPNLNASFASNPYNKSLKHEPNNSSMNNNSQLPTEAMNNYNESVLNNRQNSMIMYPNNSSTLHNNSSGQENNKIPENA